MLVAFGENGDQDARRSCRLPRRTISPAGPSARSEKDAEPVRHKGVLDGFEVGRKEAEEMIMSARVLAGWIKPEDLVQPEAEGEAEEAGAEGEDEAASADHAAGQPS